MYDKTKQLIIFVHGTGSSTEIDVGNQWWLRGNPEKNPRVIWHLLEERLLGHCECLKEGHIFHWSGKNSQNDRNIAGAYLFQLMMTYENEGRSYHLIGHSHGGSVIRAALLQAIKREEKVPYLFWWRRKRYKLAHMVSCTTIGTPFIEIAPTIQRKYKRVLLYCAFGISGLATTILPILLIGLLFINRKFDLALFFTFLWITCLPLYGIIVSPFASALLGSVDALEEQNQKKKLHARFHKRWLILKSSFDEAINGLRNGLAIHGSIVPRIKADKTQLNQIIQLYEKSKTTSNLSSVYSVHFIRRYILNILSKPLYNYVFAPLCDRLIFSQMKRNMFGADQPGTTVVGISTTPSPNTGNVDAPSLPSWIEDELAKEVATNSGDFVGKIRNALGVAVVTSGSNGIVDLIREQVSFDELIHTSYFRNKKIIDLICIHILVNMVFNPDLSGYDQKTVQWYNNAITFIK